MELPNDRNLNDIYKEANDDDEDYGSCDEDAPYAVTKDYAPKCEEGYTCSCDGDCGA